MLMLILLLLSNLIVGCYSHGRMTQPTARQPESLYWYQVGCMIGCTCSGGGKDTYPSLDSVNCKTPAKPTLSKSDRTWNIESKSPKGDWNMYMPWRAPGTSKPLDSCGIASGFLPSAKVQFPHSFSSSSVKQGDKGTELSFQASTKWVVGSTVEAAFTLSVNHGGGYQYRVCPYGGTLNEECFEKMPLKFADKYHTIRTTTNENVQINALDVVDGVIPSGHAWRRLPIPACNCDLGSSCLTDPSSSNDYKAYAEKDSSAFGKCTNGLQFQATHLTDGTWKEGYGYYVSNLYGSSTSTKESKSDACSAHADEATCKADTNCAWFNDNSKTVCYTNTASKSSSKDSCADSKDETSCKSNSDGCTWYSAKGLCYKMKRLLDGIEGDTYGIGSKESSKPSWEIVDKLIAPSKTGKYVLQWRWDNEQTPQIWTTCSHIEVVDDKNSLGGCATIHASLSVLVFAVLGLIIGF
jgi:hypothetical protein